MINNYSSQWRSLISLEVMDAIKRNFNEFLGLGQPDIKPVEMKALVRNNETNVCEAGSQQVFSLWVVHTTDLPEFGWLAVETNTVFPMIIPAYPKPIYSNIIGIAKEPAYKIVDE